MKKLLLILLFAPMVFGQTAIYRSIQFNNTNVIADLSGNAITISGSTLTATSALPDSIGVGDAVQYDSSNAGAVNAIAFIHGRTSSTVYTVKRFNGGTPASCTGDTDGDIFRAYTTLGNAEAGTENTGIAAGVRAFDAGNRNIQTANEQWNFACYRSTSTTTVTYDDWDTASNNYIRVYCPYLSTEVGVSQFQKFFQDVNGTCIQVGGSGNLIDDIRFEGLKIRATGGSATSAILLFSVGNLSVVSNCILIGSNNSTGQARHCGVNAQSAGTYYIYNNVAYNWISSGAHTVEGGFGIEAGTALLYNNTEFNCRNGIHRTGGTVTVKNNIAHSCTVAGYSGTFSGGTNNQSTRTDSPGTNPTNVTKVAFTDSASNDFSLKVTDTTARNKGADLSADTPAITDDIIHTARPVGSAFDIGAYEQTTSNLGGSRNVIIIGSAEKSIKVFAGLLFSAFLVGLTINRKFK